MKNWSRNCLYGAGMIPVLLVGLLSIEHFRGKARLTRYKSELAAAGEKLSVKEFVTGVAAEENGFPSLMSSLAQIPTLENSNTPPVARIIGYGKSMVVHKQ